MSHRRGKIARLPKELRDTVNRMLNDGAEYRHIIAELEKHRPQWPAGIAGFNKVNINKWRHGGYEEWRAERQLREEHKAERAETFEFLRESGPNGLNRAVPDLAMVKLFDMLFRADSRSLAAKVNADPNHFTRMVNALLKVRQS